LVRLSTKEYQAPTEANREQLFMHLTNYSINKDSDDFVDDTDTGSGSKRSMKWMMEFLEEQGDCFPSSPFSCSHTHTRYIPFSVPPSTLFCFFCFFLNFF
jgi:hypothetical protein